MTPDQLDLKLKSLNGPPTLANRLRRWAFTHGATAFDSLGACLAVFLLAGVLIVAWLVLQTPMAS